MFFSRNSDEWRSKRPLLLEVFDKQIRAHAFEYKGVLICTREGLANQKLDAGHVKKIIDEIEKIGSGYHQLINSIVLTGFESIQNRVGLDCKSFYIYTNSDLNKDGAFNVALSGVKNGFSKLLADELIGRGDDKDEEFTNDDSVRWRPFRKRYFCAMKSDGVGNTIDKDVTDISKLTEKQFRFGNMFDALDVKAMKADLEACLVELLNNRDAEGIKSRKAVIASELKIPMNKGMLRHKQALNHIKSKELPKEPGLLQKALKPIANSNRPRHSHTSNSSPINVNLSNTSGNIMDRSLNIFEIRDVTTAIRFRSDFGEEYDPFNEIHVNRVRHINSESEMLDR